MADISALERALINADAAGDAAAARVLAGEISRVRNSGPAAAQAAAGRSTLGQIGSLADQVVEGFPIIGPLIKKGQAGVEAIADTAIGNAPSVGAQYDKNIARDTKQTTEFAAENPITSTTANIAGGVLGTAPLMVAAPAAFGAAGGTMLARSIASMISGGLITGADSAVRSGGDLVSTGAGGALGLGMGVVTPVAARGLGKGVSWLADKITGASKATGPIAGLPKPAADYALNALGDPSKQAAMQSELQRLGPQGMLADVSQEWQGVARGAASQPGMRDEILNPLIARDAAKNARLRTDLDTSLGPARVPSQVAGEIEAGQAALGPRYNETFRGARAVNTEAIAEGLEADAVNLRGPAQQAVQRVRQMLNVHGEPDVLDPSPFTLFQTRQAIDGLLTGETNPQVLRVLGNARRQIDETLGAAVPGIKDVDAQFAELARQNTALGRGQQMLDSGRTAPRPQEVAAEMAEGAIPQGNMVGPSAVPFRLKQGARADIDRIVGTNANDPAAMQKLMKSEGDWNRDKLRTLFGGQNADDALGAVDRETTFYRTNNRVGSGSDTAMAGRFGDFLDAAATPSKVPTDSTVFGATARGAQKIAQTMLGANAEETAARFAKELGRLSVAQGSERDAIVQALLGMAQRRQSLEPLTRTSEDVARMLMTGARPDASRQLQGR